MHCGEGEYGGLFERLTDEEGLELLAAGEVDELGVAHLGTLGNTVKELEAAGEEEEETGNLDGETGHEDVGANVDLSHWLLVLNDHVRQCLDNLTIYWLVTGYEAAMPPPAACTTRLTISQPRKKVV